MAEGEQLIQIKNELGFLNIFLESSINDGSFALKIQHSTRKDGNSRTFHDCKRHRR